MLIVNTHEAKSRLSELLQLVESGEEVVIARAGKPVARLTAIIRTDRKPGYLSGVGMSLEELNSMDGEIAEMFEQSVSVLSPGEP